jgi:purine-binding chemotaxis protein CheW
MKKKNKVENSLERLFSAKKTDLISNEESVVPESQATPTEVKAEKPKKEPKLQSVKSTTKETTKPAKTQKSKAEKVEPKESAPSVSEPVKEIPVEAAQASAPPQAETMKPEATPVIEVKTEPAEEVPMKPAENNTRIDKPMTDAIVAKKTSDYDTDEHLVIFSLAGQSYGISIMIVESIIKMQDITHVPRAHPAITGATNLRGVVLPVIDLCKKMNLQPSDEEDAKRIIVVSVEDITAGFIVDNVESVYRISSKDISPPSPMVTSIDQKYIKGIAKNGEHGLVIILEPVNIFESVINETVEKNQIKRIK